VEQEDNVLLSVCLKQEMATQGETLDKLLAIDPRPGPMPV